MKFTAQVILATGLLLLCCSFEMPRAMSQGNAGQDNVQLNATVEPKVAQVAEPVRFTLQVEGPKGTIVKFPPFAQQPESESELASDLGRFEIRASQTLSDFPTVADGSRRRWTLTLVLESIYVGDQTIPSIDIQYRASGGDFQQLSSQPIKVKITSLTEDRISPEEYRDIKSVVDVEVPQQESRTWIWGAIGTAAGVVLLAGAILLAVNRRPVMSPAQWALGELTKLAAACDSVEPDNSETFYGQLIAIVQEFVVLQFGLSSHSWDSEELLSAVTANPSVSRESRELLKELLSSSDNVKFARHDFDQEAARRSLEQARQLVNARAAGGIRT